MFRRVLLPSILLVATLPACGGGGGAAPDTKAADAAKAAESEKKAEDDAIAKRRAEREAKEAAQKEREAERDKLVEELAVLPAEMPKKLDKACTALVEAQTAFDKKHFDEATAAKLAEAAGTRLKMLEQQCAGGSLEMAACQIQVLNTLPTGKELHSDLPMFFQKCAERFAGGGGKAPAVPPKPR